jgi:hypothetical protein
MDRLGGNGARSTNRATTLPPLFTSGSKLVAGDDEEVAAGEVQAAL